TPTISLTSPILKEIFSGRRGGMDTYSVAAGVGEDSGAGGGMPFRLFFMIWLALNVRTLRPTMMISSPVCGFLPLRGRLVLTTKLPKPEIFTFSPRSRQLVMMSALVIFYLSSFQALRFNCAARRRKLLRAGSPAAGALRSLPCR